MFGTKSIRNVKETIHKNNTVWVKKKKLRTAFLTYTVIITSTVKFQNVKQWTYINILVAHKPITTLRRLYSYLLISRTKTNRRTDRELVKPAETWARDWQNTNAKRATKNGDVNSHMYCRTPFTDERSNRMVANSFQHCTSSKTDYERTTGELTIWLTIYKPVFPRVYPVIYLQSCLH